MNTGYVNNFLNPIIYARFNRDFRRAFRELLLCHWRSVNERLRREEYGDLYGTVNHTPSSGQHATQQSNVAFSVIWNSECIEQQIRSVYVLCAQQIWYALQYSYYNLLHSKFLTRHGFCGLHALSGMFKNQVINIPQLIENSALKTALFKL